VKNCQQIRADIEGIFISQPKELKQSIEYSGYHLGHITTVLAI
jgi:hypothetical protein